MENVSTRMLAFSSKQSNAVPLAWLCSFINFKLFFLWYYILDIFVPYPAPDAPARWGMEIHTDGSIIKSMGQRDGGHWT